MAGPHFTANYRRNIFILLLVWYFIFQCFEIFLILYIVLCINTNQVLWIWDKPCDLNCFMGLLWVYQYLSMTSLALGRTSCCCLTRSGHVYHPGQLDGLWLANSLFLWPRNQFLVYILLSVPVVCELWLAEAHLLCANSDLTLSGWL